MNEQSIGKSLRWARRRAGMTQQDLAEATGMLQPAIARIEKGSAIPRTATLLQLLRSTGHRLAIEPIDAGVDREAVRHRLTTPVAHRARQALGRRGKERWTSPIGLLSRLRYHGVPFVLIGDLAEVVRGGSVKPGRAVEICIASTETARHRLRMAQEDLGQRAAGDRLQVHIQTSAGDIYDVISRNADWLFVDAGITVSVAAIEDLIRDRRARGRPADLEAAAELTALAEET
ncbi:MAG: helix-turn-helix domain-containing protein [Chloroflexota bacterium]|nr:helix-turn-helix domain-containing protein [Chloroflexota bacterium]